MCDQAWEKPCREVRVLRDTRPPWHAKAKASMRLLDKYKKGRLEAGQFVMGLKALLAQNYGTAASDLVGHGLLAVEPVPLVLWIWACEHVALLNSPVLRLMLRVAGRREVHDKYLRRRASEVASTPEGLVALAHDAHRVPWGSKLAEDAIRKFVERHDRS